MRTLALSLTAAATLCLLSTTPAQAAEFDASMAGTQKALAAQPALKPLRDAKRVSTPAAQAEARKQFTAALGGSFEDMAGAGMRELTLMPGFDEKVWAAFAALPSPRSQVSVMTTCAKGAERPVILRTAVKGVNATFDFRGLEVLSASQRRLLEQQPSMSMSVSSIAGQSAITVYGVFAPFAEKRTALPELHYAPKALSTKAQPQSDFERCERPSTHSPAVPDTSLLTRAAVPDARPGSAKPFDYTDDQGRKWWLAIDTQGGNWALAHRFEAGEEALAKKWFEDIVTAHHKAGDAPVTVSRMSVTVPGVAPVQVLNQAVYQYTDDVTETVMLVANRRGIQLVRRFVR